MKTLYCSSVPPLSNTGFGYGSGDCCFAIASHFLDSSCSFLLLSCSSCERGGGAAFCLFKKKK